MSSPGKGAKGLIVNQLATQFAHIAISTGVKSAHTQLASSFDAPHKALSPNDMKAGLTRVGVTARGNQFAFLEFRAEGKELTDVSTLETYSHLQALYLANNHIADVSVLAHMAYAVKVDVSHNRIANIVTFHPVPKNLQELNMSHNLIAQMSDLSVFKFLRSLSLANNSVSVIDGLEECTLLQHLDLSNNTITTIQGLASLKLLRKLDLHGNGIKRVENMETLKLLLSLNLADNQIRSLKGLQHLESLETLVLDHNNVQDILEIKYIRDLRYLRALSLVNNPIQNLPDYRTSLVFRIPQLASLDNSTVTEEDKVEGINMCDPPTCFLASTDHAMHTINSFDNPLQLLQSTPATWGIPYPILALIGTARGGKRAVMNRILQEFQDFLPCVAHTTRPPREHERDGGEYHFVNDDEMEHMIAAGQFIQTCRLFGHMYGVSVQALEDVAAQHKIPIVLMELEGAESFKLTAFRPCYVYCNICTGDSDHSVPNIQRAGHYRKLIDAGFFDAVVEGESENDVFNRVSTGPVQTALDILAQVWNSYTSMYR